MKQQGGDNPKLFAQIASCGAMHVCTAFSLCYNDLLSRFLDFIESELVKISCTVVGLCSCIYHVEKKQFIGMQLRTHIERLLSDIVLNEEMATVNDFDNINKYNSIKYLQTFEYIITSIFTGRKQ